nr:unnamed protein product [Digitaria exilis]
MAAAASCGSCHSPPACNVTPCSSTIVPCKPAMTMAELELAHGVALRRPCSLHAQPRDRPRLPRRCGARTARRTVAAMSSYGGAAATA